MKNISNLLQKKLKGKVRKNFVIRGYYCTYFKEKKFNFVFLTNKNDFQKIDKCYKHIHFTIFKERFNSFSLNNKILTIIKKFT